MVLGLVILLILNGFIHSQLTNQELDLFRMYNVTITDDPQQPQRYWIFSHSGMPHHENGPFPNKDNPNTVTEQNHNFKIPKNPAVAAMPGCLPQGTIAAAVNGVPLFNPYSAPGFNAVEGDNKEIFDSCDGHPAPRGAYHYHKVPTCLYKGEVDELVGVSLDGYPIYGPLTTGGKTLVSADLDACHGRTVNNKYEYRLTYDYPYIMGCFRGVSTKTAPRGQRNKRQTEFNRQSCLYASFCEIPADGCPNSAYTWDPIAAMNLHRAYEDTTISDDNGSAHTVQALGLLYQIVPNILVTSILLLRH